MRVITLGVEGVNRAQGILSCATRPIGLTRDVLRNRHVAGLLLGDLLANAGTGMIIVAMPVQSKAAATANVN